MNPTSIVTAVCGTLAGHPYLFAIIAVVVIVAMCADRIGRLLAVLNHRFARNHATAFGTSAVPAPASAEPEQGAPDMRRWHLCWPVSRRGPTR